MVEEELNRVRELKKRIYELELRREKYCCQAENIVPIIDGMPHAKDAKSRVEKITVELVAIDEEMAELADVFVQAVFELDAAIEASGLDALEKAVINLRYVACMNFRDIQEKLKISDATTFYIHRTAKKKILKSIQAV